MLSSPRQRARSRLNARSVKTRAGSRLKARSGRSNHIHLTRRYLAKGWKLLGRVWRLLLKLELFILVLNRLDLKSWLVAGLSWAVTGLALSYMTPDLVASIPPVNTYWPLILLLAWDIYWSSRGLGLSRSTSMALTGASSWWIWLRLQNVTTNLWLMVSMGAVALFIYAYVGLSEKYLFSRKSIRKGILR